jgi:hypothetical protein
MDDRSGEGRSRRGKKRRGVGVRATLLLVLAVALGLGRFVASARREHAAAAAIEACGGVVRWDDADDGGTGTPGARQMARRWADRLGISPYLRSVAAVSFPAPWDPDWRPAREVAQGGRVRPLADLRALRELDLRSGATDAELAQLPALPHLEELSLNAAGDHITDAGLAHLAGLTGLRWLWVGNSRVTDRGLVALRGMSRLEFVCLQGGLKTGEGLGHLAGATRLRHLKLLACGITDAGIDQIIKQANLESLTIRSCRATAPALDRLAGLSRLGYLSLGARLLSDDGKQRLRGRMRFVRKLSVD